MKAFWWFKENSIAGMARPGLNALKWFDFPFDEAVLLGWLGKHSSDDLTLQSFHEHTAHYAPKIFKFYELDQKSGPQALEVFNHLDGIEGVMNRLADRSGYFSDYKVVHDKISITYCSHRLQKDIKHLLDQDISHIVTLTEKHHHKDQLQNHFDVTHIAIDDLGAPKEEQVHILAGVIQKAQTKNEKIAVHCLAGIGRTSTMLIAAHIVLGESKENLRQLIKKQNPIFTWIGDQGNFLDQFKK